MIKIDLTAYEPCVDWKLDMTNYIYNSRFGSESAILRAIKGLPHVYTASVMLSSPGQIITLVRLNWYAKYTFGIISWLTRRRVEGIIPTVPALGINSWVEVFT